MTAEPADGGQRTERRLSASAALSSSRDWRPAGERMLRAGKRSKGIDRLHNSNEVTGVPLVLVAAVGDLRGAIEIRVLDLVLVACRSGVDVGGQSDGSGGQDQGRDQGLGKH